MKLEYIIEPDEFTKYARQIVINNINWQIFSNYAHISCIVKFGNVIDEVFIPLNLTMFPNYNVILVLEDTTMVNQYGQQIIDVENGNEEDFIYGEYSFFINSLNNNVPLSYLLENGVNASVSRGRFNI